jgi:hypothetical protein
VGSQEAIWRSLAKLGIDPRSCRLTESSIPGYDWQILHQPSGHVIYGKNVQGHYYTLRYSFDRRGKLLPLSKDGGWRDVIGEIERSG